ncbi:reverse transcriptase/maturase family protein [Anaerovorax sp. IOR16]|uniref:reverse transcriptase/maturase family protein n=1 Tax=Anaerovorax sp. IOR16 TaxID=2773458 RepID=UPI0019D122F6|nr:reverse transcriptase/maturase family protein [Anaerovorax sp. IOR16]
MSKFPLYEKLCDYEFLKISYKQTQIGERKYRKEAIIFDMARERNLVKLWRELKNETYQPQPYISFKVYEPKEREINAPRIRDKIVQYAAHQILFDVYKDVFIKNSYACLVNKGVHKAVDALQHNMRLCKWQYGTGWIIKIDVRKYFYSIQPSIIDKLIQKKIKDEKFLNFLRKIIYSYPYPPLGNATSQDFANIVGNEIDQYATRFLGLKWYIRYMDDIVVVVPTKEQAQETLSKLNTFVEERLQLEFNQKTKIFPIEQGVNAYGFKIYTTHRLVRNSSKASMKRKIKAMDRKLKDGTIKERDVLQSVNSWLGHARHSNSYNLANKIFTKYDYVKIEHPKYNFGGNPKDT